MLNPWAWSSCTHDTSAHMLQCKAKLEQSLQLEKYLKDQHTQADEAKEAEFSAKDEEFSRFWRYSGLPRVAPHLELDKSKLAAAGLLDHRNIGDSMRAKYSKEVLNPLEVKEFSDSSAAPHYLAETSANRNRAKTHAGLISKCKKAIAEGKAFKWHTLPPDALQAALKANAKRHKLNQQKMNGAPITHLFCLASTRRPPRVSAIRLASTHNISPASTGRTVLASVPHTWESVCTLDSEPWLLRLGGTKGSGLPFSTGHPQHACCNMPPCPGA